MPSHSLNCPRDLFLKLATPDLIQLVKRNAIGPRRWRQAETSGQPPKHSRTVYFPIHLERSTTNPTGIPTLRAHDIRVSVDGRHLVVSHSKYLEVWDLSTGHRKHLLEGGFSYGIQYFYYGHSVRVAILREIPQLELEIVSIDNTGARAPLYWIPLVLSAPRLARRLLICEQFVAIIVQEIENFFILFIDWSTETYVLVDVPFALGGPYHILIPGSLILIATSPDDEGHEIHVYSIDSFINHWRHISTLVPSSSLASMDCAAVLPSSFTATASHLPPGPSSQPLPQPYICLSGLCPLVSVRCPGHTVAAQEALRMGTEAPVVRSSSMLYTTLAPYGGTVIKLRRDWVEILIRYGAEQKVTSGSIWVDLLIAPRSGVASPGRTLQSDSEACERRFLVITLLAQLAIDVSPPILLYGSDTLSVAAQQAAAAVLSAPGWPAGYYTTQ
ncbi:hypothetical protein FB451DRAFT_1182956 [Mycena latifolia]|nr:hypothetical protein FB451DRAFT_1182956 [Mycena latifolia]